MTACMKSLVGRQVPPVAGTRLLPFFFFFQDKTLGRFQLLELTMDLSVPIKIIRGYFLSLLHASRMIPCSDGIRSQPPMDCVSMSPSEFLMDVRLG